jgi:hypothetical protein
MSDGSTAVKAAMRAVDEENLFVSGVGLLDPWSEAWPG